MSRTKIPHIILDSREKKLMEIFDKDQDRISYETRQLDIADVVISMDVACERKEGFDFVSSIMDNRLFEQLVRLKETYPTQILFLEGLNDEVFESTGMNINSIYGALAFVSYKLGISVIPTRNINDTVIAIERVAYREQIKDEIPILSRKAPKGMNDEERRAFILEGLLDTGPSKAKMLITCFKTPYKVIQAIKNTRIIYTRTGNPKGINGPLSDLSGFGWKYIEKNQKILFGIPTNPQKTLDGLK